jgi:hypothetical protein
MPLEEGTGNITYNIGSTRVNGTLLGGTWQNDGVNITLTSLTDYTLDLSSGLFTVVNTIYLYNGITILFNNLTNPELAGYCTSIERAFGSFGDLIALVVLVIVLVFCVTMFRNGQLNKNELIITSVMTIVFVVVINIFGAIVVGYLC